MPSHNFSTPIAAINIPYGIHIQRGDFGRVSGWEVSGYNPDVSSNFETVWDGSNIYTYPASALAMTATSVAAATDNGVAITIIGLDSNYNVQTETITLAGLGTATTSKTFLRIHRAFVSNNTAPTDTINITNGGTTYAKIIFPYNTTQMAIYTVPRNYRAYLVYASVSLEKQKETVSKFMTRSPGGIFITGGIVGTTGFYARDWVIPPIIPEKTDIEIRSLAGATTAISANMQFVLEKIL